MFEDKLKERQKDADVVVTLEQTVARLKYSLELVKTLFGSMDRASVYNLYASSVLPPLNAALPSSFFCISCLALCNHKHKQSTL